MNSPIMLSELSETSELSESHVAERGDSDSATVWLLAILAETVRTKSTKLALSQKISQLHTYIAVTLQIV